MVTASLLVSLIIRKEVRKRENVSTFISGKITSVFSSYSWNQNGLAAKHLLLDRSVVPVKDRMCGDVSTYCLIYLKYLRFYNFFRLSYILMNGTLQLFYKSGKYRWVSRILLNLLVWPGIYRHRFLNPTRVHLCGMFLTFFNSMFIDVSRTVNHLIGLRK